MNTKMIVGALIGGLLVFIWQFLSWTMLNIHGSQQKYTSNQDTIISFLNSHLQEDGTYFLPNAAPGATQEENQKLMESSAGKPWAQISYHSSMNTAMGMNLVRGFLVDVFAVMLLIWLLSKIPGLTLQTSVLACLVVGIIGYLTTDYTESIWYENNSIPDLIDAVVSWTLCGAWLGYYLKK